MKAVVWHDVGKISVDEVPDPSTPPPSERNDTRLAS